MSAPRCVVLGGHGFVGSACVRGARARGYEVQSIGRAEYPEAIGTDCDLLINANGNSRKYLATKEPLTDFRASVESVLRSCLDFKAQRYVFLSSIDVYPVVDDPSCNREDALIDPARLSRYGLHKWLAEQIVRQYQPDALMVRMGGFVGPGLWKNPIYDLLTGQTLRVDPESAYQYMTTNQLAEIIWSLLEHPRKPKLVNICGDGVLTLREIAAWIPNARLPEKDAKLNRERYEINTDLLRTLIKQPPQTRAAVSAFVQDVLAGRVDIRKPEYRA